MRISKVFWRFILIFGLGLPSSAIGMEEPYEKQYRDYLLELQSGAARVAGRAISSLGNRKADALRQQFLITIGMANLQTPTRCNLPGDISFTRVYADKKIISICEEGLQIVTNISNVISLIGHLLKPNTDFTDTDLPLGRAIQYYIEAYIEELHRRSSTGLHRSMECSAVEVSFIAVHTQSKVVCSRENPDPARYKSAVAWAIQEMISMFVEIGRQAGSPMSSADWKGITPELIVGVHSALIEATMQYLLLHEMGHFLSKSGPIDPVTSGGQTEIEIRADRFVFDVPSEPAIIKAMTGFALLLFWQALLDGEHIKSEQVELIQARAKGVEQSLCKSTNRWPQGDNATIKYFDSVTNKICALR